MFPWSLTGISLATEWGSAWVMWVTVREKLNIRGHLDLCYLRRPPKGVGKESWRSLFQPQLKPGSSPTLHSVSDGFVWPGRENLQGWKFLSIWAPIPVLHCRDHGITRIKQGRSHWWRPEGCFGCSRAVLVPQALLFPWVTPDTELRLDV